MKIVIRKWYMRLLVFIGLGFLGLVICYLPGILSAPAGFLAWLFLPVVGIVGIGSAAKHYMRSMKVLRFLVIFSTTLIFSTLFWAIFQGVLFKVFGDRLLEAGVLILFTAPMMALWTLACLMILALWPFHAVRNVEASR